MTQPAGAFAPGSPASSPSSVLGGNMTLPPLNFQSSSAADGRSQSAFDNSGFVVNYRGALSTGPGWLGLLAVAAVIGGALWLARRR